MQRVLPCYDARRSILRHFCFLTIVPSGILDIPRAKPIGTSADGFLMRYTTIIIITTGISISAIIDSTTTAKIMRVYRIRAECSIITGTIASTLILTPKTTKTKAGRWTVRRPIVRFAIYSIAITALRGITFSTWSTKGV